jgi:hypothetical protein
MAVMQNMRGVNDETQLFRYNGLIGVSKHLSLELGHAKAERNDTKKNHDNSKTLQASVGGVVGMGSFNLGAYVSRNDWLFSESQAGGASNSVFDDTQNKLIGVDKEKNVLGAPQRPIELLFGFGLSETSALGLRLAYASYKSNQSSEDAGAVTKTESSADQLDIGVGYHSSDSSALDVSATITALGNQKGTEKAGAAETSLSIKNDMKLSLDGRWLESYKQSGVYGAGTFMMRSATTTARVSGTSKSGKYSDQHIALEGGYNFVSEAAKASVAAEIMKSASSGPTVTVGPDGPTFSFASNSEKKKIDTLQLNGKFGAEAMNLYGNFGLMAGMSYVVFGSQTSKDNTTGENLKIEKSVDETSDSSLWTLGAFYASDALRVDAVYSRNFLYNGPFLISGNSTSPWIGRISASYRL